MNKTTNILLVGILAILVISLFVGLGKEEPIVEKEFGFGGYNELGYIGMTHATSGISITIATGTTHTVLSANSGRMYARIRNDTAADYFTLQLTNSTSTATGTTPTFGTNLVKGLGIFLDPGEEYIIGPDNLWKGEVVALASSTATATINYMEK